MGPQRASNFGDGTFPLIRAPQVGEVYRARDQAETASEDPGTSPDFVGPLKKGPFYVRPFPAGPGRWKVSAGRGLSREPR